MLITGILFLSFGLVQQVGWSPDFAGPPSHASVSNLVVQPDGSVIAAGSFESIDGVPASNIARWDGSSWSALGEGSNPAILRMLGDGHGGLIVFDSAKKVRRWSDSGWQPVFSAWRVEKHTLTIGTDGRVFGGAGNFHYSSGGGSESVSGTGVLYWKDGEIKKQGNVYYVGRIESSMNGDLFVYGTTGSDPDYFIGEYNPSTNKFDRISEHENPAGMTADASGNLYVAVFSNNEVLTPAGLHMFDGSKWENLGMKGALPVLALQDGTILLKRPEGEFIQLYRGDANGFSPVAGPVEGDVTDVAYDEDSGDVYVSGMIETESTNYIVEVAVWRNGQWRPLRTDLDRTRLGASGRVRQVLKFPSGDLYALGTFSSMTDPAGHGLVRWTGSGWEPVDHPFESGATLSHGDDGRVYALARRRGEWRHYPFVFDSGTWVAIADSIPEVFPDQGGADLRTMYVAPDGTLYAGGLTGGKKGTVRSFVGVWDGDAWEIIGRPSHARTRIFAISSAPDGSIMVGGRFEDMEGVSATNVVRWDGTSWHAMGDGLTWDADYEPYVSEFEIFRGSLIASGKFRKSGQTEVGNIARWDGSAWQPLGKGTNGRSGFMQAFEDELLFVSGDFNWAGNRRANDVGVWDGEKWHDLDGGTNGRGVSWVLPIAADSIWIAGEFSSVGGVPSQGIGVWTGLKFLASDSNSPGARSLPDAVRSVDQFPNPSTDQTVVYVRVADRMSIDGEVYDLLGRRIARFETRTSSSEFRWDVDVSSWAPGVYVVSLRGPDFTINRMMTVVR